MASAMLGCLGAQPRFMDVGDLLLRFDEGGAGSCLRPSRCEIQGSFDCALRASLRMTGLWRCLFRDVIDAGCSCVGGIAGR